MRYLQLILMLVFMPIALLGMTMSGNEYQEMGIEGAIDCDGVLSVLLFAVPALLIYLTLAILLFRRAKVETKPLYSWFSGFSAMICLGLIVNIAVVTDSKVDQDYQAVCGGE